MPGARQEERWFSWEMYSEYQQQLQEGEAVRALAVSRLPTKITSRRLKHVLASNLPLTILWTEKPQMFIEIGLKSLHSFVLKVSCESKCELE